MAILGRKHRGNTRNAYTRARETPVVRVRQEGASSIGDGAKGVLKWALGLCLGVLLLVGLFQGGLCLYRLAMNSDFFAIQEIGIRGAHHFSEEAILEATGLEKGVNSLTVNIADVERSLRSSPWVASAAVKRKLPDAFEILIREKIPAFWVRRSGVLHYADNRGRVIAPVEAENFLSLPTLEILPGGEALLPQLDSLMRSFQAASLPVDMAGVSLFRVSAAKGFELFLENRDLILCVAADEWEDNLRRMGIVLSDLARRGELKKAREVWAGDGSVWVVVPDVKEVANS